MLIKCDKDGVVHYHRTVTDLMKCSGDAYEMEVKFTRRRTAATPPASSGVPAPTGAPATSGTVPASPVSGAPVSGVKHVDARPTGPQLRYIFNLGGSWRDAYLGKRGEAGDLITMLKDDAVAAMFKPPYDLPLDAPEWDVFPQECAWRKGELGAEWSSFDADTGKLNGADATGPSSGHAVFYDDEEMAAPVPVKATSRMETMLPMVDRIPTGYYATAPIDNPSSDRITFLRVSRPKSGQYKDATKVQTLHGDRLMLAWVLWPSGKISIYNHTIEDYILMLIANHIEARRLFADKRKRCCRCGTGLTDPRSRKLGIGPDCEEYEPGYVQATLELLRERGEWV